jgi:hypothetical protein
VALADDDPTVSCLCLEEEDERFLVETETARRRSESAEN